MGYWSLLLNTQQWLGDLNTQQCSVTWTPSSGLVIPCIAPILLPLPLSLPFISWFHWAGSKAEFHHKAVHFIHMILKVYSERPITISLLESSVTSSPILLFPCLWQTGRKIILWPWIDHFSFQPKWTSKHTGENSAHWKNFTTLIFFRSKAGLQHNNQFLASTGILSRATYLYGTLHIIGAQWTLKQFLKYRPHFFPRYISTASHWSKRPCWVWTLHTPFTSCTLSLDPQFL